MDWQPGRSSGAGDGVHPRQLAASIPGSRYPGILSRQVCSPHRSLSPTRRSATNRWWAPGCPTPLLGSYLRRLGSGRSKELRRVGVLSVGGRVVPDLAVVGIGPSPLIRGTTLGRSRRPEVFCYRSCYRSRSAAAPVCYRSERKRATLGVISSRPCTLFHASARSASERRGWDSNPRGS